jgi:hypothetical protein
MAAGVKLRSREAVCLLAQGFTGDDSPGEDERWPPNTNPSRLGYRLGSAGVIFRCSPSSASTAVEVYKAKFDDPQ